MLGQDLRNPSWRTHGCTTVMAAWKGLCHRTECEGGGNSDEGKRKTYNGDSAEILSPLRGWVLCQWKEAHRIWMATYHCVAVNAFSPN